MARTRSEVVAWAKHQHEIGSDGWAGMCLKFVRMAFGAPGGEYDANSSWHAAQHKHSTGQPPAGTGVYWSGGHHGHVAVSAGKGMVWSTDILHNGKVDKVEIPVIRARWGLTYRGWTEDVSGVWIKTTVPPKPVRKPGDLGWYVVTVGVLNGRTGAGTSYKVKAKRAKGTKLWIHDTVKDKAGAKWARTNHGTYYLLRYLKKA